MIELEEITSETIDNSLIFGGNIMIATQVLSTISDYLTNHQKENFAQNELKVRIISFTLMYLKEAHSGS